LRNLKDSLLIVSIGAESVSFVKLWGVLPVALLIMVSYTRLLNIFKEEKVFYIIVGCFLLYFSLFQFYLMPNSESLQPHPDRIKELAASYPFAKYFIFIYGKWIYVSFYIMAEMWGSTVLSLLFWQFANKICSTEEAKRFYPIIIFFANIAIIISGLVVKHYSNPNAVNKNLMDLVMVIIVVGLVIMCLYRWIHLNVLTDPNLYSRAIIPTNLVKKPRLSMRESFKLIANSKYLGMVAILVCSYGFSMNLMEGPWKAKVNLLCQTREQFSYYMGHYAFLNGSASLAFLILGSYILRKFSWLTFALVTPIVFLITGTIFFTLCIFQDNLAVYTYSLIGLESLTLVVTVGTIQNILSRCVTFSFHDSAKEIAYIPLDKELKTKGKAAVDIIGTRLGKAGGSLIQSLGFIIFHTSNLIDAIPYLMVVFVIVCIVWIYATISLNKEYLNLLENNKDNINSEISH
jgi:AAA family ATP:ADP antiporter